MPAPGSPGHVASNRRVAIEERAKSFVLPEGAKIVKAYCPSGSEIIGTCEKIPVCCSVTFHRDASGKTEWAYDGGKPEAYPDALTLDRDDEGTMFFMCRDGGEWRFEDLSFKELDA